MSFLRILIVVVTFGIALLPGSLWAQGPVGSGDKTSYAVLKLGSFIPEANDLTNQNANNGFVGQVAFGYYLAPYFSLEAAVGYQEFKGSQQNLDIKYGIFPLEVTGKFGLPLGFFEPYLAVGFGGYYTKAQAGNVEEDSTRGGFFAGLGFNLNLGETFFIGVEGKYRVLNAPAPTPTPYSSSATGNINLDGLIVTGNLGFRF
jgi:hypothetical protein